MRATLRRTGAPERRAPRSPLLARALATFYLAVVAWMALWILAPAAGLRWQPVVITSGSMGPRIQSGDVVLLDEPPDERLRPGQVITFEDPARRGALVTHRIVAVNDDGSYTTRGDANRADDSTRVDPDDIVGVGRLLVPAAGLPATWLGGDLLLFTGWTLATFAAVVLATGPRATPGALPAPATTGLLPLPATPRGGGEVGLGRAPSGSRRPRPALRRPVPALLATAAAIGCVVSLQTRATAAFLDQTDSAANSLLAGASFAYPDVVAADSPVAYWRLGESTGTTATDQNATHNSTYTGGVTLGATGLVTGTDTAVDFNGTTGYVAVPNHAAINTGGPYSARTIEMWIRADNVTARQVLFEEGGASRGLNLYVDGGLLRWGGWNLVADGAGTPWGYLDVTTPIATATTYHVVAVFDQAAGKLELFVNGASVGTVSGVGPLYAHSGAIGIGAMNSGAYFHTGSGAGSGNYFDGRIDEVAIYNSVLSPGRVNGHNVAG